MTRTIGPMIQHPKAETFAQQADKGIDGFRKWLDKRAGQEIKVDDALAYMLTTEGLKVYGDLPGRDLSNVAMLLALRA